MIEKFLKEAKESGKNYAVLKTHKSTPSWEYFYTIYDREREDNKISLVGRTYNDVIEDFKQQAIKAFNDDHYDFYMYESQGYRNIKPKTPGTQLHRDPSEILHWQCRGATEWKLGVGKQTSDGVVNGESHLYDAEWLEEPETIILEPGDILWMNIGVWHSTENLTEKMSIVFEPLSNSKKTL
jgi:hypothetical protein